MKSQWSPVACCCGATQDSGNVVVPDAVESGRVPAGGAKPNVQEARPAYTFPTGAAYTGQWLGDSQHGDGTQVWPDGAKYVGDFVNDKYEGQGVYTFADGSEYSG